jgi:hypothetical protein
MAVTKNRRANGALATPDANTGDDGILQVNIDATKSSVASVSTSSDKDVVKVNNANLTELKNACDDALKRVCSVHFSVSATNTLAERLVLLYSSSLGQISSNKYTRTPTYVWR